MIRRVLTVQTLRIKRYGRWFGMLWFTASIALAAYHHWQPKPLVLTVQPGDHLLKILGRAQVVRQSIYRMLALGSSVQALTHLQPGQTLSIQKEKDQVIQLVYPFAHDRALVIDKTEKGYVAHEKHLDFREGSQYHQWVLGPHAFYSQARAQGIPRPVSRAMAHLLDEASLVRRLQPTDQFASIYSPFGQLIAMRYTHHNHAKWWIRFRDHQGVEAYYDEAGHSLARRFERFPLHYQWISSKFTWHRYHPVLKHVRPHKGVDLAAYRGTPVWATADGVVQFAGMTHGYGRMVRLKHGKHYQTIYAHFSRFAKHLHRGQHVRRHQVIGYVGQSGLATGSHCHYEIRVNGIPHDPLTIALPYAHRLGQADKARFLAQKTWINEQFHRKKTSLLGRFYKLGKQTS